jgi:hypothetical protein
MDPLVMATPPVNLVAEVITATTPVPTIFRTLVLIVAVPPSLHRLSAASTADMAMHNTALARP